MGTFLAFIAILVIAPIGFKVYDHVEHTEFNTLAIYFAVGGAWYGIIQLIKLM